MEAKITFFIVVAAAIFINETVADCEKLPANFNPEGCCKFPSMGDEATIAKITEQFKDQKLDEYMTECKVSEAMFKEMKLVKDNAIDKDALLKYMDTNLKEANWKPVMKTAVEECYKEITATKDEIVKQLSIAPFNINKDKCNVLFMSMITCVHLEGFENCPKDVWTEEKRCTDAKAWITKCEDSIDSMKQLSNNRRK